jgi:hypothetical protein
MYEAEIDDEPLDEDGSGDELSGSSEEIDLSTVMPKLLDYKKYLNKECSFELSLFCKNNVLKYYQADKWLLEFQELRETAIEQIEEDESERLERLEKAKREREKDLVAKLRNLIKDSDFVSLSARKDSTQRAMQTYALEAIPELQELSQERLKEEIRFLSDRIKAKKILKK